MLALGLLGGSPCGAGGLPGQGLALEGLARDARWIMITGAGIGGGSAPSALTVRVNGVEFVLSVPAAGSGDPGQSALRTCQGLQELVAGFTVGSRLSGEFEALCLPAPGEAALLAIQASTTHYPVGPAGEREVERLARTRQRRLLVEVRSTDGNQRLHLVR